MRIPRFCPSVLAKLSRLNPLCAWSSVLLMTLLLALSSPAAAQSPPEQTVIQSQTHVVLVNVVAKDKHGKPVDDLQSSNFVLLDNNQEQKIALFAREESSDTASLNSPGHMTFSNRPDPGVPAVTAFLFDELNTSLTDQEFARKDFLRYLRGLPSDSRVAVFVLGDSLVLLHDFSQDMTSLIAAIDKHTNRVNPQVAAAMAPPGSANSLTGGVANSSQWDSFIQASNQAYLDEAETVRATTTAAALETIAGHLQGIPGRKTLIWISGGFPIQLGLHIDGNNLPQGNPNNRASGSTGGRVGVGRTSPGSSSGNFSGGTQSTSSTSNSTVPYSGWSFANDVELAVRALNEADVAVYPIDARGVTTPESFGADRSSMGKRNKPPGAAAPPDYNYETLDTLAVETGGKSFHHINDLSAAIHDASTDARVSYSLAFYPATGSLDGSYHRLVVNTRRPDVKLQYRPGYFAAPDSAIAPLLPVAVANPVTLAGIGFTVHLDPVEGGYKASITIDPRNITMESKDGKWMGSLQFLAVVGKVEQLTTIPLNLSPATYQQVQAKGLMLSMRVKTPQGTTGFSLGLRDIPSGMVGTLHVQL
jgi:VWFA-related protein